MKQFLIVGSIDAITYANVFPYIKSREVHYRPQCYGIREYDNTDVKVTATWYTTMETPYIPPLQLTKSYNPDDYPKYDNYDAIEVSKIMNIPYDYEGVIGVPVTFLNKWNPEQFEIVTIASGHSWSHYKDILLKLNFNPNLKYNDRFILKKVKNDGIPYVNGNRKYNRIMIKNKMI